MARYVPPSHDFVQPTEEPDSWGDEPEPEWDHGAPTEISTAPRKQGGGQEAQSGPLRHTEAVAPPAVAGGYSVEELAALVDDDDWGEGGGGFAAPPPAPQQHQHQPYTGGFTGPSPVQPYGGAGGFSGPSGAAGGGYGGGVAASPAAEHMCPTCNGPTNMRTSNTQKNPGRQFYKCSNQACGYFKWADEVNAGDADGGSALRSPATKRRATGYGGSQSQFGGGSSAGGYQPGYGYGGGGGPPPVPGANTFQAAADGGALRDRSNDVCYKCNTAGHWASNCPNPGGAGGAAGGGGGGGGGKSADCYKCGQGGHWARDCPNEGANNGGAAGGGGFAGSRYKAGGGAGGGASWGGPQGGAGGYGGSAAAGGGGYGGGGGGGGNKDCYKCGQPGHWSRDCPNQGNAGGGGGGGNYGGGGGGGNYGGGGGGGYGGGGGGKSDCYKCGGSGHWARDCPGEGGGAGAGAGGGKRKWDGGGGGGYGKGRGSARGDSGACFKCGGDHFTNSCPNK